MLTLGLAFGALFPQRMSASATSYEPAKIFSAGTGGTVGAYKTGNTEADKAYVGFSITQNEGRVYYRRSLAYMWWEKGEAQEGGDQGAENQTDAVQRANPGEKHYFSMTFSFPVVNFEKFTFTFESNEENVTKDGKATNKLSLEFDKDGNLGARVSSADSDSTYFRTKNTDITDWTGDFTLSFYEAEGAPAGEFALRLGYKAPNAQEIEYFEESESDSQRFAFTNIGDNYAEYRSSAASKPNTPMTFMAEFKEEEAEGDETKSVEQKILIKELNGQPLEVTNGTTAETAAQDGTYAVTGGTVEDTKAPALVFSETVYSFTIGQKYSLTHHAVDVLDDSVTVTRRYYAAKKNADDEYVKPDESKTDDYTTLTTSVSFMPVNDTEDIVYLSIRFELEDGRQKGENEKDIVYLSWYADDSAIETKDGWDYITAKTESKKSNPSYKVLQLNDSSHENEPVAGSNPEGETLYEQRVREYQEAVNLAASKASAGEGSYVYLPSLRDLIGSDSADYRNLKFSIYYFNKQSTESSSAQSETSLSYNALKLPVNIEGAYSFRVLATDASGKAIRLYHKGDLVDVTGSNIWDIDDIPTFTFYVEYNGITIEDSGEQTLGYRESSYSIKKFDIVALSGYATDYTLYYFNEDKLSEGKTMPSYGTFVKDVEKYMADQAYAACLEEIQEYNDKYNRNDEEWDKTDNDYNWRPSSSLSFTPQKSGYYVLKVKVSDAHLAGRSAEGYQVIEIRNPLDVTPGRSNWLENNKVSVILFSISGVLAIAIVVLLVVKPSEKTPEDIDLNKLKGKKKEKPSKK